MDFGNITPPDQQAMINALMQQIETLKRNGNDDILALITAKLTSEAAASAASSSTPSFSTILPSPSSSISSPSQASTLMSQLPTPLGIYQQQSSSSQNSMTNITASSLYHHSSATTNPLSPPSIIPSPSSAFCIPSVGGSSGGGPSTSSMMSGAQLSGAAGAALGGLHNQSEIAELLKTFSFSNILQNVQNFGNLPLGFPLPTGSSNSHSTNFQNSHPALSSLSVQQHQAHQPYHSSTLPQQQFPYLKQEPSDEQPQSINSQSIINNQSIINGQSITPYLQPSTSNSFGTTDDDETDIKFHHLQHRPRSSNPSGSSTSSSAPKRKRKSKPQFDDNGKPIVQRIRRRRRNGSIPEEDAGPKNIVEKITPPGCRKQQPPLPDSNNEQQQQQQHQQQHQSQSMITPDDPIIHSPPSLRPNQMASQIQGYNMGCQQQQQNDLQQQQHPLSRPPPSAAPSAGPPQNYESPGSFQRSDSLSGDESCSSRSKRSKLCRVCGDNATGYNFNVITCESCKAFFRRNANRLRGDFKCPYSDDCEINAVSRRFCQKCRLKKCFTVGMKKEWILNEDQLKRRKNSRLNHRTMKPSSSRRSPHHNQRSPYSPNNIPSTTTTPRLVPQQQLSSPQKQQQQQVGQQHQRQHERQQQAQLSRNGSIDNSSMAMPSHRMKSAAAGGRSFSMRSSMDITSPSSITNASTPVSLSMMSPINSNHNNSISPTTSSPVSKASTPPQMSPKLEPTTTASLSPMMKLLSLNEIIHGYQIHITPQAYHHLIQSPPPSNNTQTVKIVVQAIQLFNPTMLSYFGCGEYVRISLPITDYAQLITMCGNNAINQSMELQNGDIRLPEEAYEPLKRMIEEYTNRAMQQVQQQQQISPMGQQQGFSSTGHPPAHPSTLPFTLSATFSPSSSTPTFQPCQPSSSSAGIPTTPTLASPNIYHSGPLAIPSTDGYNPNCNEIRTTTLLTSTIPQYDPLSSINVGPQPEVDPMLLPEKFRHQWAVIDNAINDEFHSEDQKLSPLEMPKIEKPRIVLNTAELKELDSIRSAFTCMDEPLTDFKAASYLQKAVHDPSDIMNIMDITIRRIVKTAKKLARFQEISNDGKLVLLKSSMIDMLTIRGVVLLDEKMKNFSTPVLGKETKVSMDMFDKLTDPMQKQRFMTFCSAIDPQIRKNQMAVMLVALVVLFDDSRASKLSETDRAIVKHYHEMYYHLLQRYIESVYGEQAIDMIKTVPVALQRLAKTSATSINLFLGRVNTKDVAQLPTEFFKIEAGSGGNSNDAMGSSDDPSTSGFGSGCEQQNSSSGMDSGVGDYSSNLRSDRREMGS